MRDLGCGKQQVVCNPLCPTSPPELWKNILDERFIDLEKFYASEHTTIPTRKRDVKVDKSSQLGVQEPKPDIRIHTHGQ